MKAVPIPPPADYSKIMTSVKQGVKFKDFQEVAQQICKQPNLRQLDLFKKLQAYLFVGDTTPIDLKINILQTMAALTLSQQKSRFTKHIITRVYHFLKRFTGQICRSNHNSKRVIQIIKRWEQAKTFSEGMQHKLKYLSMDLYSDSTPTIFNKYKKQFLQNYRDIQSFESAKTLYDSHVLKVQALGQLSDVVGRYQNLRKTSRNHLELMENSVELKVKVAGMIEKLVKSLKLNKKGAEQIATLFQKVKEKFEAENNEVLKNKNT